MKRKIRLHKALKHKTQPDTFGVIMEVMEDQPEMFTSEAPSLMQPTATMALIKQLYVRHPDLIKHLEEDYELVTLEIREVREKRKNIFTNEVKKILSLLFKQEPQEATKK